MSDVPTSNANTSEPEPPTLGRTVLGVLAGGAVLVGAMLLLAAAAILFGWIQHDETGSLNLGPWLILEVVGGAVASVLAGWVCRNISRQFRGPGVLALVVLSVGLLEASELLRYIKGGTIEAPLWLVLIAPVVAASGILLGGFRRSKHDFGPAGHFLPAHLTALWRYSIPATVLLTAVLISLFVLPEHQASARTTVVASALTLDLTVGVPALVYLLLVRARRVPWIAMIPTVVVGYVIATVTIPEHHHGFLESMRLLIIPGELALVTYLLIRAKRAFAAAPNRSSDFVTRFRSAASDTLGNHFVADVFTTEIGILYHAFRRKTQAQGDARTFTTYRKTGYLSVLIGLSIVLFVETIALHVLVSHWSGTAAWILTGLSVYAMIWFLGDYRALASRPIRLSQTHLHVRVGLRWEVSIAIDGVSEVRAHVSPKEKSTRALNAVVLGKPNLRLKLRGPIEVIGMYGIRKTTSEIWLQVDEADELCKELHVGLTTHFSRPSAGASGG